MLFGQVTRQLTTAPELSSPISRWSEAEPGTKFISSDASPMSIRPEMNSRRRSGEVLCVTSTSSACWLGGVTSLISASAVYVIGQSPGDVDDSIENRVP